MSTYTTPAQNDAGPTDDAPTHRTMFTTLVCEICPAGPADDVLPFDVYSAAVTCASDSLELLVEADR